MVKDDGDRLKHSADPFRYSHLLDSMSPKRRAPVYTISKSRRFPLARATSAAQLIGPGHYRLDSDFPLGSSEQLQAGRLTRSAKGPNFGFDREERTDEYGALKGTSATAGGRVPCPMSPGSYTLPDMAVWRDLAPSFSVPRARSRGKA